MDFDNDFLISLVQGFDCVYDPTCKEYKSRHARDEAWTSICKSIVGDSWEDMSLKEKQSFGGKVQKRWKCLKDAYIRSLKTRVEKRVSGGKSGRPYVYEQQMAFLKQSLHQSKSSSDSLNVDIDADSSEPEEIVVNIDPDSEHSNSVSTAPRTSSATPAKRRRTLPSETSDREFVEIFKSSPSPSPPVQPSQNNEGDKMFLLSLLPTMQDMSAVEKIDFKIKVMKLLKDDIESRERRRSSKSRTVGLLTVPGQEGEVQDGGQRVLSSLVGDEHSSISAFSPLNEGLSSIV